MRWSVALLVMLSLSGCVFTFIPLVPEKIHLEPRLTFKTGSQLAQVGEHIVLHLELAKVPSEGFVGAYLYRALPDGGEEKIGEDSKLANPQTTSLEFRLGDAVVGQYRALVFWQGAVERQFEFELK
jgi:hypothetical protein